MRILCTVLFLVLVTACDTQPAPPVSQAPTAPEPRLPAGFADAGKTIQASTMFADVSIVAGDKFEAIRKAALDELKAGKP